MMLIFDIEIIINIRIIFEIDSIYLVIIGFFIFKKTR